MLSGGALIAIKGELGAGKTVLARGIIRGLGVAEDTYITSPTYTLIQEYRGRLIVNHIDLYRLSGNGEIEELGLEELIQERTVTIIEWAEKALQFFSEDHLEIKLSVQGENVRQTIFIPHGAAYQVLVENFLT